MGEKRKNRIGVVAILIIVLIIIILLGIFIIVNMKKNSTPKESEQNNSIQQIEEDNDNNSFVFKAPNVKTVPKEANATTDVQIVHLYLDDNVYYSIQLPSSLEIVTDNSKYIYAKDNTVSVSVVSGVTLDDFSKFVSIAKSVSIQPNLIRTEEGVKGPQEAAKHIANDKAIIIRTYDNPVAFKTILNGLERDTYKVTNYNGLDIAENKTEILTKLPNLTGYHVTIDMGLGDDIQKMYIFQDGTLTMCREFKQFDKAVSALGTKVAVITGKNTADKVVITDTYYYAECENYTIAVASVNFNTQITLFGYGEEARFNIIAYINS